MSSYIRDSKQEYLLKEFFETDTEYYLVYTQAYCELSEKTFFLFGYSDDYEFPPLEFIWITLQEAEYWYDKRLAEAIYFFLDELDHDNDDFQQWTIEEYPRVVVPCQSVRPELLTEPSYNDLDWDA